MTSAKYKQNKLENQNGMPSWIALILVLVCMQVISSSALARKAQSGSESSKGKEGAKTVLKQKSSKKFAVKAQHSRSQKVAVAKTQKAPAKISAKNKLALAQAKTLKSTKTLEKTNFVLNKKPETPVQATHELAKAFSMNQQNQLIDRNAKPTQTIAASQIDKNVGNRKMPSLLPTTNDSQRAASMLEAGSGVHDDDGYTRTQIVDAPVVRRPAAVTPKEPERVAITFEHPTEK